ncbi:MAG: hypothetical protein LW704_11325 [Cryomorphaceae bacterium]|jgi:hypothetical protein|nr:hypothetical protein [Cryomorphaceae bacterium]
MEKKINNSLPYKKRKGSAEQVERSGKQVLKNQQALESIIWDYDPQSTAESFEAASASVLRSVNGQSMIDTFTSNLGKEFNHG